MLTKILIIIYNVINTIGVIVLAVFIYYALLQEKELELTHKEENESRNKN